MHGEAAVSASVPVVVFKSSEGTGEQSQENDFWPLRRELRSF